MLQSAELILTYAAQYSKDEFVANVQLQDSVIRRLLVIAEAARRVSEATRQALPRSQQHNSIVSLLKDTNGFEDGLRNYCFGSNPKFLPMILSNQRSGSASGKTQLGIGLETTA